MAARYGDTLCFEPAPVIVSHAAVGGKREGEGPLAACFDELSEDNFFGQSSWEAAERQLQVRAARLCLKKSGTADTEIQLALAGDLQAQCTASGYAMRELGAPFAGLFGACSTMAEALGLGAALCSAGFADNLLAMASGHFCAAERQFRTPLSYGAVRTPTAQWTATAAGCCLLRPAGTGARICAATFGRIQDYQVKDINNMGAAMAPAAAATLIRYLEDLRAEPQDFDCIYTGDLGHVGSQLLHEILAAEGLLVRNHVDCGCLLYDAEHQTVKSGASGPGCCASVLCGHILPRLERGSQRRVLFLGTGALMSQTTFLQKESIPAVAHLVELRAPEKKAGEGVE
ncbi:MAG: stage V sporulation protein AD [Faecalibacterium sp.]